MAVHGDQGEQRGEQMKGQPWRAGLSPRLAASPPSKEQSHRYLFYMLGFCVRLHLRKRFLNENK